jgi:hypothetical protein
LTVPTFLDGNETWTIKNKKASKVQTPGMKYSISVQRSTKLDQIRNDDIGKHYINIQ